MQRILLFLLLLPARLLWGQSDTLTLEQCQNLALQVHPLQQRKTLAADAAALQLRNVQSNNLPRIGLGAQATWQSDVFGLPINSPLFEIPEVPKDQYKLAADVSERLWDGGSDRYLRRRYELERELTTAQVDVDVFQLRETVADLFFKILLLQESDRILALSLDDLQRRLRQTEAAVAEGAALRTAADQVKIQILRTEQQRAALQADRAGLLAILSNWTGRRVEHVQAPAGSELALPAAPDRPEYRLFDLQQQQLQLAQDQLQLRLQPRVEAFAQGGLGRPNPFNFFETDFQPFLLLGVRAAWTPIDWGNRRREAQALRLQADAVNTQRQAFDQRLQAALLRDQAEQNKAQAQLAQDDALIALQQDIVRRAETQVQNGVMTMTDYLTQLSLLTQAQLNRKTHELQLQQAQALQRARMAGE